VEVRTHDENGFMQSKTRLTRAEVEERISVFQKMLSIFPKCKDWVLIAEHYPATKDRDKPADFLVLREMEK
jgi:hypothetical protein